MEPVVVVGSGQEQAGQGYLNLLEDFLQTYGFPLQVLSIETDMPTFREYLRKTPLAIALFFAEDADSPLVEKVREACAMQVKVIGLIHHDVSPETAELIREKLAPVCVKVLDTTEEIEDMAHPLINCLNLHY